jgi:hypothetical protein
MIFKAKKSKQAKKAKQAKPKKRLSAPAPSGSPLTAVEKFLSKAGVKKSKKR